jgi:hypothetical protein
VFCKENNTHFLETLSSLHNCVGKLASFFFPHVIRSLHEGGQFLNKVFLTLSLYTTLVKFAEILFSVDGHGTSLQNVGWFQK